MKNILSTRHRYNEILVLLCFFSFFAVPEGAFAQCEHSEAVFMIDGNIYQDGDEVCMPINDFLDVHLTINGASNSACSGDLPQFTFIWSRENNATFDTTSCLNISNRDDFYEVYTVEGKCGGGLTNVDMSLTVVDVPEPEIVVESCSGNELTLRVENEVPANFGIVWRQVGVGNPMIGQGPTVSVQIPSQGEDVTVRATIFYNGSIDCTNSAEFDISSDLLPDLTVDATPTTVCENDSARVMASSISTSVNGFSWSRIGSNNSMSFSAGVAMLPPGTYEISTLGEGCNRTDTLTIGTIFAPSKPTVTPVSPAAACPDETVMLTASGGSNYVWLNASMGVEGMLATLEASPGTYTVTQSNAAGCVSDPTQITVPSKPTYEPSISTSVPPPYCEGDLITLTADNLPTGATASWSTNTAGTTIEIDEGGEYTVTYSGPDGCDGSETETIEAFGSPPMLPAQQSVSVASGTPATVTINLGEAASILIPEDSVLTTNASISSIQLTAGNNLTFTATASPGARALGAISFKIIPFSMEGCRGPARELLVRVTPDVEAPFIPEIISPNGDGSNDKWSIVFPADGAGYDVVVYSRGGAVVFEGSGSQMPWDAGACPNGVYYYQISERGTGGQQWQGALTIIGRTNN